MCVCVCVLHVVQEMRHMPILEFENRVRRGNYPNILVVSTGLFRG